MIRLGMLCSILECGEYVSIVVVFFAQPHNHAQSMGIDVGHESDLTGTLVKVVLVDADGVDPHGARESPVTEAVQGCEQVVCDVEKAEWLLDGSGRSDVDSV